MSVGTTVTVNDRLRFEREAFGWTLVVGVDGMSKPRDGSDPAPIVVDQRHYYSRLDQAAYAALAQDAVGIEANDVAGLVEALAQAREAIVAAVERAALAEAVPS